MFEFNPSNQEAPNPETLQPHLRLVRDAETPDDMASKSPEVDLNEIMAFFNATPETLETVDAVEIPEVAEAVEPVVAVPQEATLVTNEDVSILESLFAEAPATETPAEAVIEDDEVLESVPMAYEMPDFSQIPAHVNFFERQRAMRALERIERIKNYQYGLDDTISLTDMFTPVPIAEELQPVPTTDAIDYDGIAYEEPVLESVPLVEAEPAAVELRRSDRVKNAILKGQIAIMGVASDAIEYLRNNERAHKTTKAVGALGAIALGAYVAHKYLPEFGHKISTAYAKAQEHDDPRSSMNFSAPRQRVATGPVHGYANLHPAATEPTPVSVSNPLDVLPVQPIAPANTASTANTLSQLSQPIDIQVRPGVGMIEHWQTQFNLSPKAASYMNDHMREFYNGVEIPGVDTDAFGNVRNFAGGSFNTGYYHVMHPEAVNKLANDARELFPLAA